jgi:DnaJ-class molecular chaperone
MRGFYRVLRIPQSSSMQDVRKAYLERARQCHPDMTGRHSSADEFKRVQQAYATLGNESKRAAYDAGLGSGFGTMHRSNVGNSGESRGGSNWRRQSGENGRGLDKSMRTLHKLLAVVAGVLLTIVARTERGGGNRVLEEERPVNKFERAARGLRYNPSTGKWHQQKQQ